MNYYLNAFNEMLRKRQENQMGGGSERAPTAFDAMSNAQKADYYSNNPTMAAITQGLQKGFGMTSYGMLQNALAPDFVREQQAIAQGFPDVEAYSGSRNFGKESSLPAEGVVSPGMSAPKSSGFMDTLGRMFGGSSVSLGPVEVQDRTATPNPFDAVPADAGIGGSPAQAGGAADSGGGGRTSGGNYGGDAYGGSYAFNQGGMVTPERLMGRAPAPDDGYGALQGGEYVITKAAVERYGKAMMDAINNGTFR